MNKNIKTFLEENSDTQYAKFNRKLIFSQYPILGVRTPILKKFARNIMPEDIELSPAISHEGILLYGFSLSNIKDERQQLEHLSKLLPYIDNWATCDSIVPMLKKTNGELSYSFYSNLLKDKNEFFVRVGIIGLMRFFMKTDKIDEILENIKNITQGDYYVKMAVAWFYAELCVVDFHKAKQQIYSTTNKFIRNKAISKAQDSFRLSINQKQELKKLKV